MRSDVRMEKPKNSTETIFSNKAVDSINLPALLRSTSVTDKIPVNLRDKEPLIVSYEYWWFAYDVIKNMIMQIMINLPKIMKWIVSLCTKFEVVWINENSVMKQKSWRIFYYII